MITISSQCMTFTPNSAGGKYSNVHSHNTSFGWDGSHFYTGRANGAENNDYTRTSIVSNGYIINAGSSPSSQVRLNWTEDQEIKTVQPYITVYFWRRTA